MSTGSSTESYPAFARIGLRENPGKNLNQITYPDQDSNPGHLVLRPDALTTTPQVHLWADFIVAHCNLNIGSVKVIEQVSHFQYLGCNVTYEEEQDINKKTQKCQHVCGTIRRSLRNKVRKDTQLRFYTTMALPAVMYGSEAWVLKRNLPATSVAQQFVNMHGRPISAKTVRRRLKASGLISSRPATGPRLLRKHRVERLRFANDHRDWRNGQWSCVLFTDESRFNLCSPDGRVCMDARTELVFVENGRLIADRYINECLADHVVPFGQFVGDNFVLMHDNARPHIAHVVGDYLQEVGIHVLPWPARSPDMNPIEHVWDMLGRRVKNDDRDQNR
ncbi:hypothetical protein ANN_02476 [Periplaneta americana]|uniref:Transposase n=1 Tax=Periplaneta americana TaxID=6978 RepID=A0ABQ8TZN0_PERAM|nr:hypothetical protein ANN_02476 [Periplaneta americana]